MRFCVPFRFEKMRDGCSRPFPLRTDRSEQGFTLAALLVILTIISVLVAYTVPEMWSTVMQRERDRQTIWTMKQYARAIHEYQRHRGTLPTSLEQLEQMNPPRVLRRKYLDPLTGKFDWIPIPPGTPPPVTPGTTPSGSTPLPNSRSRSRNPANPPATPGNSQLPGAAADGKFVGPFVGVRPARTGESFLTLNGADRYENWYYTITELQQEISGAPPPPPR